jgi:ribosomal protein S18 acetylase RimI-like enzyme
LLVRAQESDVDRIVAFEAAVSDRKLYGRPLDREGVRREIALNDYWLRLCDGRTTATGAVRQRDDGSVYLSNIAVLPEARREGYAREMLRHLLSLSADAPSIDLAVHPENAAARALYAAENFIVARRSENHFGDGEPRLIMVRARI